MPHHGKLPGTRLSDLQPCWQRVRARAGLKDARIHDLRHTFASAAVAAGQGLPMIGKLLGAVTEGHSHREAGGSDDLGKFYSRLLAGRIARTFSLHRDGREKKADIEGTCRIGWESGG